MIISRTTVRWILVLIPAVSLWALLGFNLWRSGPLLEHLAGDGLAWGMGLVIWVAFIASPSWDWGYVTPEMRERDQARAFRRHHRREIRRMWRQLIETPVTEWENGAFRCRKCGYLTGSGEHRTSEWSSMCRDSRRKQARREAVRLVGKTDEGKQHGSILVMETAVQKAQDRFIEGAIDLQELERVLAEEGV